MCDLIGLYSASNFHRSESSTRQTYRQFFRVAFQNSLKIQLFDFTLQATRQTRVHSRTTRQNDVLVKVGPRVDVRRLDRVEQKFRYSDAFNVN